MVGMRCQAKGTEAYVKILTSHMQRAPILRPWRVQMLWGTISPKMRMMMVEVTRPMGPVVRSARPAQNLKGKAICLSAFSQGASGTPNPVYKSEGLHAFLPISLDAGHIEMQQTYLPIGWRERC